MDVLGLLPSTGFGVSGYMVHDCGQPYRYGTRNSPVKWKKIIRACRKNSSHLDPADSNLPSTAVQCAYSMDFTGTATVKNAGVNILFASAPSVVQMPWSAGNVFPEVFPSYRRRHGVDIRPGEERPSPFGAYLKVKNCVISASCMQRKDFF